MKTYLDLLSRILTDGVDVPTGAYLPGEKRKPAARRLHAVQTSFDLRLGFPAVTTKPLWWRGVVAELIWFLRGSGNIQYLRDQKTSSIWESWVKKNPDGSDNGDLGPCYPVQFRKQQGVRWGDRPFDWPEPLLLSAVWEYGSRVHGKKDGSGISLYNWGGRLYVTSDAGWVCYVGLYHEVVEIDQIGQLVSDIRTVIVDPGNRASRRLILDLWNPAQVSAQALPPCHLISLFDLEPDSSSGGWILNTHLVMRSADALKGVPFNIASYALLTNILARVTNTQPGWLTVTYNNVHIYDNQFDEVREQRERKPYPLPTLQIANDFLALCPNLTIAECHHLTPSMFQLVDYKHHPKLSSSSEVAV